MNQRESFASPRDAFLAEWEGGFLPGLRIKFAESVDALLAESNKEPLAEIARLTSELAEARAALEDVKDTIEGALEHGAHAWAKGHYGTMTKDEDVGWPPDTKGFTTCSEPYHWAALLGYIKPLLDRLRSRESGGGE